MTVSHTVTPTTITLSQSKPEESSNKVPVTLMRCFRSQREIMAFGQAGFSLL